MAVDFTTMENSRVIAAVTLHHLQIWSILCEPTLVFLLSESSVIATLLDAANGAASTLFNVIGPWLPLKSIDVTSVEDICLAVDILAKDLDIWMQRFDLRNIIVVGDHWSFWCTLRTT